ncbi:MAG: DUF6789 family protein [Chloroflexota bacterium]
MTGQMIPEVQPGEIGRGLAAGALATVMMSVVIVAGRAAGLLRTPPPAEIVGNVADVIAGAPPGTLVPVAPDVPLVIVTEREKPSPAFQAGWISAHLAYGAMCGLVFLVLRRLLGFVPPRLAGAAFGLIVWAGSYLGLMPALRLYPWPAQDSLGRQGTLILAHLVFGLSLSEAESRLERLHL